MEVAHESAVQLLALPAEVIIHILSYLDFADALAISCVNVLLRSCLVTSQKLQYRFASQAAAVSNNHHCKLDLSDRLPMLRKLEVGWTNFVVDFRRTLHVMHEPFGIYDLTGGIYLMGDISRRAVHYCKLPSSVSDPLAWSRIDMDPSLAIVDVGLSIYEHDLIVVVTTKPTNSSHIHSMEVHLLEFSTGKPHPLARDPVLFVRYTSQFAVATLSVGIEIVGEYLAIVTTPGFTESDGRFRVFEWKTGTIALEHPLTLGTYSSIVFLSPTHILLPNVSKGTLDLFVVSPSNPNPLAPSVQLALPSTSAGYSIRAIYGRAEPNLAPSGIPHSPRPFHPAPEDAIAIFKLHIRNNDGRTLQWGDFSMFAHRATLLRLCEEYAGLARRSRTVVVRWEDWGPPVTRWIDAAVVPWWITTTTGQRCVLSVSPDAVGEGTPSPVVILDFNPLVVKKALAVHGKDGDGEDGVSVCVDPSVMKSHAFEEDVESALPYASISRFLPEEAHKFEGLLMDDERLLGLVTDEEGRVRQIEVFHIGYREEDGLPGNVWQ